MPEWLALIVSIALCFAAAGLGSLATVPALRTWYPSLRTPPWNPPNAVFGPVWTVLYLAMAVAAWLVWRSPAASGVALGLFALQLALNVAWSVVFFGRRSPAAAVAVIVALWIAIAATIVAFAPIDALAAWLLVPYLAWVSFATALNRSIARRNAAP